MIECIVLKGNNSPVTLDDINDLNVTIECMFPKIDRETVGSKIRETYRINENSFHMYYGYNKTIIMLPEKYQKEIKKTLKNIAKLKFIGN